MDGLILAIDLGKFNSVCCWYATTTKAATFRQVKTTLADLGRQLTRLRVAVVVIEAGSPAGWVHDLCADLGVLGGELRRAGLAMEEPQTQNRLQRLVRRCYCSGASK